MSRKLNRGDLSSRQSWFFEQLRAHPDGDLRLARYHVAYAVEISPAPDLELVAKALAQLYEAHEILRTVFDDDPVAGKKMMRPGQSTPDLKCIEAREEPDRFRTRLQDEARKPFDLSNGPLFEVHAYVRPSGSVVLLLRAHHLIVDGASLILLMQSLLMGIFQFHVPQRKGSAYASFVEWQKDFLESPKGAEVLNFWLSELSDLPPPLQLPYDDQAQFDGRNASLSVKRTIDNATARAVHDMAASLQINTFRACLAAFFILIHASSKARDIPVSLATAARTRSEFINTIGWFNDTLVVRDVIDENETFRSFATRLNDRVETALRYDGYPLHLIVRELDRIFAPRPSCLDQVAFSMIAPSPRTDHDIGNLASAMTGTSAKICAFKVETFPVSIPYKSPHDISFRILDRADNIYVSASFNGDRFSRDRAQALVGAYERLLLVMSRRPDIKISEAAALIEYSDMNAPVPATL